MRVEVRLFAMLRAQAGQARWSVELPEGAVVADAWDALVADFPALAPAAPSVRFARNGHYVEPDTLLSSGDEVAVIPPVAGGAETSRARRRHLAIVTTPLDDALLATLRAETATPADGAVVAFVGQVRETPGTPAPGQEVEAARFAGQRVAGLAYEAFEPMALAILEEIADEVESRFGVTHLAAVHRVGEVALGEASVVIVTAAAHRDDAFGACRYVIEELKARVPIWKAERFVDGSVWLGQPPRPGPLVAGGPAPTEDPRSPGSEG